MTAWASSTQLLKLHHPCRVVAASAASRGVLDRQTALALKPALDQIGAVFNEVAPPLAAPAHFSPPRQCMDAA